MALNFLKSNLNTNFRWRRFLHRQATICFQHLPVFPFGKLNIITCSSIDSEYQIK